MRHRSAATTAAVLLAFGSWVAWSGEAPPASAARVVSLLETERALENIPFADVVQAVSGNGILPFSRTNRVERELLSKLAGAMSEVLRTLNATDSPARQERRINEVSRYLEEALLASLNRVPGFTCDFPRTASGHLQRSGYPDLRLSDRASGRVLYLDPKLYERGSQGSALRTFYFEPRRETNKILEDAHHLVVGVEHDGAGEGRWRFLGWELVDLSGFRVRLKAEFQAGNREVYRPEAVVGSGRAAE